MYWPHNVHEKGTTWLPEHRQCRIALAIGCGANLRATSNWLYRQIRRSHFLVSLTMTNKS